MKSFICIKNDCYATVKPVYSGQALKQRPGEDGQ